MFRLKLDKNIFLNAYESAANVDSTEIIIKLTEDHIQFQAYNSSSTYLVNTYLKDISLKDQLLNITTYYKLRYIPNLFSAMGKDLEISIDNTEGYNFLFKDENNQTISLDYIELELENEEFLSDIQIGNTKIINLSLNEQIPLLKNLLILEKVDPLIHMYTKNEQLMLIAKNIMNGLERTAVLNVNFETFNYNFRMDRLTRQILKSIDPIYQISIYPEHSLLIYTKESEQILQNYIVAVE